MCSSTRLICAGSHTRLSTFRRAPHGHCNTSTSKARCISSAHEYRSGRARGGGGGVGLSPSLLAGAWQARCASILSCPGTISSLRLAAGASTPWYVKPCRRRGGTCGGRSSRDTVQGRDTLGTKPGANLEQSGVGTLVAKPRSMKQQPRPGSEHSARHESPPLFVPTMRGPHRPQVLLVSLSRAEDRVRLQLRKTPQASARRQTSHADGRLSGTVTPVRHHSANAATHHRGSRR